jgi:hypothetical protein
MKTIKALYDLGGWPTSKNPCIYCMHSKNGPVFDNFVEAKPLEVNQRPWKPILDILLAHVHMCTLHALCRICEKILHLHFQFL